jgi:hypothetical protein
MLARGIVAGLGGGSGMSGPQRWLIVFYAAIAAAALYATWSQNLQLMTPGSGLLDAFPAFLEQSRTNPASRSITVDIGFFLLAATAFMVIEARRIGVRFVWLYVLFGFLIAISVTFPLFMIAREMSLARKQDAGAAWRLTGSDLTGLALVTLAVVALAALVLR